MPDIPPIGWRVLYYSQADAGVEPYVADVVRTSSNGMIKLILAPVNGGTVRATRFVRHIEDPYLKEHPDVARREGAWDWVPGFPKPQAANEVKRTKTATVKK